MILPALSFPDRLDEHTRFELQELVSQLHLALLSFGRWVDVDYNPANFRANGSMLWTVGRDDQVTFQYQINNDTMLLNAYLDTTTIAGTPDNILYLVIPGGYVAVKKTQTPVMLFDNGTSTTAYARTMPDSGLIEISRADVANFTASTDNTYVRCMMQLEIR